MGSGSFKQDEDKTVFESLLAAADQLLINSPLDDVTSWAPGTTKLTKGMCVCVHGGVHRHPWPKYCMAQMQCVFGSILVYALETICCCVCACMCVCMRCE